MMKTRRFKALNGAKGEYSRIVDKIAIYDENDKQIDCCVINKDDNGREYYYPSNPHDKYGLFTGRIKDAIECIREGFGDGFEVSQILGMRLEHVVRFLDREYGEDIRKKTIEGWKDTQFAYGVQFCNKNSFSSGKLVCKDKTVMGFGDTMHDVLSFKTEEEASLFIDEVNKKALEYSEEYMSIQKIDNRERRELDMKLFFDKIHKPSDIYYMAFINLDEENPKEISYALKVVQIVVP